MSLAATLEAAVDQLPPLIARGIALEPAYVGRMQSSTSLLGDVTGLRTRMAEDGYLHLPGLLDRDTVLAARKDICDRMAAEGLLRVGTDPMDAIIAPSKTSYFRPDLTTENAPLKKAIYSGALIEFFESFLGEAVRHFDFTWLRAISPGLGTTAHCDSVYMNRGTHELFTVWTPLGDVDFTLGGLMVLEGSNNNARLKQTYGMQDVDAYCENKPDARAWGKTWGTAGSLKGNPNQLRRSIVGEDGRWLTNEYRAGDVVIFSIFTVHGSLDNRSADRIRLSSDSRYQRASQPADERWVGANPVAHGDAGKRGKIC